MKIDELLKNLPTPEPPGGQSNYDQVIATALAYSKVKSDNYKKYQLWQKDWSQPVDFLPIRADIENVSRCNFRCNMCQVSLWDGGKRAEDMSIQDFKKILDEFPTLLEIKIQGFGEPLLSSDDFFEMVRIAKNQKLWIRTTTNASLLHVNDNTQRLLDSGIDEIQMSLDAASSDTFRLIRKGSNPSVVFQNMKDICMLADKLDINPIKVNSTLQNDNYAERFDIISLASDLGIKSLCFTLALSGFGIEELEERNSQSEISLDEFKDDIDALIAHSNEKGVDLRFWSGVSKYKSMTNICPWPFSRTYIGSDMRTSPCCVIGNPDTLEIDDMGDTLSELWFSDAYKNFRDLHLKGEVPDACKGCYIE